RKYKRFLEPFVATVLDDKPDCIAAFRESVDCLGSWYRYRGQQSLIVHDNRIYGITFDQFVAGYLQDCQPKFTNVDSQARFVSTKDGRLGMTHLFSYGRIETMSAFLENRLNKRIKLP
ncbi:MAG: gamma-glutamyl kinase, partial [Amylibacter sp.]